MQLEDFAKKCIHDHRNPIVKATLPIQKLFFAAATEEEKSLVNNHQEHLKTILEHQRMEKRSGRAKALWLPDNNLAKVTKVVKNLVKFFGFQNKEGIFLYPEEMLFLLETNRLEVILNNRTLSIEEAYMIVLKECGLSLSTYRVYKKLAVLGYKVTRFKHISDKISISKKEITRKRTLEDNLDMQEIKKIKCNASSAGTDSPLENEPKDEEIPAQSNIPVEIQKVYDILSSVRKTMPTDIPNASHCPDPHYGVYYSSNVGKIEPDFYLFISEESITNQKSFNSRVPAIYATCNDDVSFYRFENIQTPCLPLNQASLPPVTMI